MTPQDQDPASEPVIAEPLRPSDRPAWTPDTDASPTGAGPAIGPAAGSAADPITTAGDGVAFSTRNAGPSKLRATAVAGAAVALAVGAVATSLAASPTPAPTTQVAPGTGGSTGGSTGGGPAVFAPLPALGEDGIDEIFDAAGIGRHGFGGITITAISGSNVSLKTDDGWTRTVTVTDQMTLTKGGQDIAVSDLAVGDEVRLRQTRNDDGTYTVDGLVVVVPAIRGTVSDVSGSGFKVTTRDGSVWTVTVDGSTVYRFGTADGSLSDVTNGETVLVQGESTGDNALGATSVTVAPDVVAGTVTSKTSETIVVTKRDGSTVTIHVDADTVYRVAGVEEADLGDVAAEMGIRVAGRARADGSIDADTVIAGPGRIGGKHGGLFDGGGRGFGGFGRGMGPGHDDADASPAPSPTTSS